MRRCAVAFAVIGALLAYQAVANEKKAPPELDPKVCQEMVAYIPDPNNGPDYKPGVDVHGKPVVEADLNPSPIAVPEKVQFNLTVDLAKYMGLQAPTGLEGEAVIGKIEIDTKTGQATFNGQPLEGNAQAALRDLCVSKPKAEKAYQNKHNQ